MQQAISLLQYCIHAASLQQMQLHLQEIEEERDQDPVIVLSLSPLYAAVGDGINTNNTTQIT